MTNWNHTAESFPKESGFYWVWRKRGKIGGEPIGVRLAQFYKSPWGSKWNVADGFFSLRAFTHWTTVIPPEPPT